MSETGERVIDDTQQIDVLILVQDFLKVFRRMWIPVVVLALVCSVIGGVYANFTYRPYYTASSTFTVNIRGEQKIGTNSSTSFYDNSTAEQMAATFPHILTSGALQRKVASELGVSAISGKISASVVENTNLLTLSVRDTDPERAYETLQAVIDNYPSVSEVIVGKVNLRQLDETGVPVTPDNEKNILPSALEGMLVGLVLGIIWVVIVMSTRKTVRREDDIEKHINQRSMGSVPYVHFKERSKQTVKYLRIIDESINPEFKEAIRMVRNKVDRCAKENSIKTILITSSLAGEGKSTIAINLAISLAQEEKKVVLIDCDLRNPSDSAILDVEPKSGLVEYLKEKVELDECIYTSEQLGMYKNIKLMFIPGGKAVADGTALLESQRMKVLIETLREKADYVILDSAPVGLLTDSSVLAQYADGSVFVVRKDFASKDHILSAMEHLSESNIQIMGCVLNGD